VTRPSVARAGVLLLLAGLCVGCMRTGGVSAPSARAPLAPTAAGEPAGESAGNVESSALAVASIEVGSAYDFRARKLGGIAKSFPAGTEAIYVVARLRDVAAPGRLEGRWVHLDSDTHLGSSETCLIGHEVEARFSLSKPTAGWPVGQYKFYLAANGEDVTAISYSVTGDGDPAGKPTPVAGTAGQGR
jgi:hypothetical protein